MYLKFRTADGSILPSPTHIEIKLKNVKSIKKCCECFIQKSICAEDFLFSLHVKIHFDYLLYLLMRYKELSLMFMMSLIFPALFLEIRIGKGSRTTIWQRTRKVILVWTF